jgi:anti-sigma-K factor RskA
MIPTGQKAVWETRSFWGVVVAAVAHVVLAPDTTSRWQATGEGVGAILAAAGFRAAISKNGQGK